MRTIIILILYVVITILSLPMYLIEAIVRLISPRAAAHIAQVIVCLLYTSPSPRDS